MGFRPLSDIPAELAARITPLQDGQTTDLISVRDGVHVLKLLERKQNEQKPWYHSIKHAIFLFSLPK